MYIVFGSSPALAGRRQQNHYRHYYYCVIDRRISKLIVLVTCSIYTLCFSCQCQLSHWELAVVPRWSRCLQSIGAWLWRSSTQRLQFLSHKTPNRQTPSISVGCVYRVQFVAWHVNSIQFHTAPAWALLYMFLLHYRLLRKSVRVQHGIKSCTQKRTQNRRSYTWWRRCHCHAIAIVLSGIQKFQCYHRHYRHYRVGGVAQW